MAEEYRHEIESLHRFFVDWYTGVLDETAFGRLDEALGPSFELVSPDGTVHDRADILGAIRDAYESHDPGTFDIEIRNVEVLADYDDVTLVRYEEWQDTPDGVTGRLSTAVFGPAGEDTPEWRYVHETWLEE
jgi:hypothetical protein